MSKINPEKMITELQELMGDKLQVGSDDYFNWLIINPDAMLGLMQCLKNDYGFNYLDNLTSVD